VNRVGCSCLGTAQACRYRAASSERHPPRPHLFIGSSFGAAGLQLVTELSRDLDRQGCLAIACSPWEGLQLQLLSRPVRRRNAARLRCDVVRGHLLRAPQGLLCHVGARMRLVCMRERRPESAGTQLHCVRSCADSGSDSLPCGNRVRFTRPAKEEAVNNPVDAIANRCGTWWARHLLLQGHVSHYNITTDTLIGCERAVPLRSPLSRSRLDALFGIFTTLRILVIAPSAVAQ
jgi:hypothetical protein